jgi:hypothetical protein
MFGDKVLQHDTLTVVNIRIVSKCKDAGCREYALEECCLRPRFGGVFGSPYHLAVAFQAVD